MARIALDRLALILLALTINTAADDSICYWYGIRGGVVRDHLYLDGGTRTVSASTDKGLVSFADPGNGSMFRLNFSRTFEVSTANTLSAVFDLVAEGASQASVPDFFDGFMFADAYEMYTYGGQPNADVLSDYPAHYLYGYEFIEKDVTVQTPQLGADPASLALPDDITRYITYGAGVNVPSENMGFYFGGYTGTPSLFDYSVTELADSLISIDMTTERQPTWSNTSVTDKYPQVMLRASGGLVWIPVGTKGVLLAIGGVPYPESLFSSALNGSQVSDNKVQGADNMQNIPVYDVANGAWYVQSISGTNYPPPLIQFCSVVVSEQHAKSYEIYIYGGYNGISGQGVPTGKPSDDVWVLSVPSFTWTHIPSNSSTAGRYGHFCAAPYPNQMFVIGGISYEKNCLTGHFVQVFNLNTLQWQQNYDPNVWEEYSVPSAVANNIAKQPTANWSQSQIGDLFSITYPSAIATYYPYKSSSPSPSHTNVAAIAGGAAGGVCLIVLILAILWYRHHSKKKEKNRHSTSEIQPYEQVSRWRRGVAKTDPSVTTTEVEDGPAVNPRTGGYYKPAAAEAPGDEGFHRHGPSPTSPRPGGFAEAGGGTRRISAGQTISPRSPRSPQSGATSPGAAAEIEGEERYEMEVMQSQRGSGDMGDRTHFRDHHLYPLSVSDGDGRSQTSGGPSYSGPSHTQSQSSRGEASQAVPSPYIMARPGTGTVEDAELPASPVSRRPNHFQHTRNISSISSGFPQVLPPMDLGNPGPTTPHASEAGRPRALPTSSEDDLDALEAFHTGSPQPFRPTHTRNLSSLSSGINQLPTPQEELSEEEKHRQSTLLGALASPRDGMSPRAESHDPLLGQGTLTGGAGAAAAAGGGGVNAGDDLYSPSSYSKGSTLVSGGGGTPRSPVTRKPVGGFGQGQGLGIAERGFEGHDSVVPGEERQTL